MQRAIPYQAPPPPPPLAMLLFSRPITLQVRSRFAPPGTADADDEEAGPGRGPAGGGGKKGSKGKGGGGGTEDLAPFFKCLARLGFAVQSVDTSNTMFFVAVLRKVGGEVCTVGGCLWCWVRGR